MAGRKLDSNTDSDQANDAKHDQRRPPTSADVARLAKVSQATVSYVLNDVPESRVSEETRERVLAAAAELGYVPHAMARSLRAGHSNLVILPFFDWPFNPSSVEFQQSLATNLDKLGYTVLLQVIRAQPIMAVVQVWASLRPIGVIVEEESLTREAVEVLQRAGIRAILAIGGTPSTLVPTALNNFVAVGRLAGEHLAGRGHRDIAVLVPRDRRLLRLGLERLQGIEEIGRLHGLRIERVDLGYDMAEAQQLVDKWRQGPRPSAVFTYNDEYSMLLMRMLQDAGFRIPDELALVGCDNLPLCELLRPRLTSVRIGPAQDGGKEIADFLDSMIRGATRDQRILYLPEPELMIRDSS